MIASVPSLIRVQLLLHSYYIVTQLVKHKQPEVTANNQQLTNHNAKKISLMNNYRYTT